jgi:hypothetical protein
VLAIATFHMQGRTPMRLWNHSIATWNESSGHLENGLLDVDWIGSFFILLDMFLLTTVTMCNASFLGM